jgi:hypothetical protein
MEGELAALELRWREAEEIARIADSLGVPGRVMSRLERLRARLRTERGGQGTSRGDS